VLGICGLPGSVHLFLSGHFEQCLSVLCRVFVSEVPGKQFIDPVDEVFGNAGQDLAKVPFELDYRAPTITGECKTGGVY